MENGRRAGDGGVLGSRIIVIRRNFVVVTSRRW